MLEQRLNQLLEQTELELSDQQKQQLLALVGLLHKWNKAYNLTSVREPEAMLVKHIMDSVVVSPWLRGSRFIDVGTGPGLTRIAIGHHQSRQTICIAGQSGKAHSFYSPGHPRIGIEKRHSGAVASGRFS